MKVSAEGSDRRSVDCFEKRIPHYSVNDEPLRNRAKYGAG